MRKQLLATAGVALAMAACCETQAATYIPVPPVSGASTQTAFAINDSNIIGGAFNDSGGIEHGFFGPLDGSNYTTFDAKVKGATGTEPRYLGNKGTMNGFLSKSGFQIGQAFFRHPNGNIQRFKSAPHTPMDGVVQGINNNNTSVGDYFLSDGATRMGFVARHGDYIEDYPLNIQGYHRNSPRGITDDGNTVAGLFDASDSSEHGFVQTGQAVQVIDYPNNNPAGTVLEDINNAGVASGQWPVDRLRRQPACLPRGHKDR